MEFFRQFVDLLFDIRDECSYLALAEGRASGNRAKESLPKACLVGRRNSGSLEPLFELLQGADQY